MHYIQDSMAQLPKSLSNGDQIEDPRLNLRFKKTRRT